MKLQVLALAVIPLPALAAEVEFIRGDANDDGRVTFADCFFIHKWLFGEGPAPGCVLAADADDDGYAKIGDSQQVFNVFSQAWGILPPFPLAGPDPTPNADSSLHCRSYSGKAEPMVDEVARLRILDAVAEGDTDDTVYIRVALSSARAVSGYRGTLRFGGAIARFSGRLDHRGRPVPEDLTGTPADPSWSFVRVSAETLGFGLLRMPPFRSQPIEPGEEVPVIEFRLCLAEDARQGSYPMALEEGELVDAETGSAIYPVVEGGVLTVLKDVASGVGCKRLPQDCAPPVADLKDLRAVFSLEDTVVTPGERFTVPLRIRATADLRAYWFTVDFDEEVLEAIGVEFTYRKPDGTQYFREFHLVEPSNVTPGSAGIDEGYVVGEAWFSFSDDCNNIRAGVETVACRLHLRARLDAPPGAVSELRFLYGARRGTNDAYFVLDRALGRDHPQGMELRDGKVFIASEFPRFRRGDANADGKMDISDPIRLLGVLYLGEPGALCPDALDSNDDGTTDISDPIFSLERLFLGGRPIPLPGPEACGLDPTEDTLGSCFYKTDEC